METIRTRLERNIGGILTGLILIGCLLVLRPFVSALLWAVVLCFATWPVYSRLLHLLRGRRTLAALLTTVAMILVVLLPFVIIGAAVSDDVRDLTSAVQQWTDTGPPPPPSWLGKVPLVGERAVRVLAEPNDRHRYTVAGSKATHRASQFVTHVGW